MTMSYQVGWNILLGLGELIQHFILKLEIAIITMFLGSFQFL